MTGPLKGVRVLDLTTNVAGPCATMVLGDLGADIIKIERPAGGDEGRQMGPHQGNWGAYFVVINRGKRSLALDVRQPEGRAALLRLAELSDVFIESFRGGKAAALGLDENVLRSVQPNIIYASLSAYGPRGPEYEKPGYDALLQARTGIRSVTGAPEGPPVRAGVSVLDMGSGIWAALGIIAALFERQRSGKGQRVDTSLFQTGVMWMAYHLLYRQFTGEDPTPQGSVTETWLNKFDENGVPASPAHTVSQLLSDRQLAAINQLEAIDLPDVKGASVSLPHLPIELSSTPSRISGPPPNLGQHGRDILREAGFSDEDIEALVSQGIVRLPEQ